MAAIKPIASAGRMIFVRCGHTIDHQSFIFRTISFRVISSDSWLGLVDSCMVRIGLMLEQRSVKFGTKKASLTNKEAFKTTLNIYLNRDHREERPK